MARRLSRWLPALGWMVLIFIGSSIPSAYLPEAHGVVSVTVHFVEYFVLATLLLWAVNKGFRVMPEAGAVAVAFLVSAVYAVTDELHQIFVPGRVPDMIDVLADTLGAAAACIGVSLAVAAIRRRRTEGRANSRAAPADEKERWGQGS